MLRWNDRAETAKTREDSAEADYQDQLAELNTDNEEEGI
jgi:hypothetical protein